MAKKKDDAKDSKPAKGSKSRTAPSIVPVRTADLDRLVDGTHHDPHSILGPHAHEGAVTVRVLRPNATAVVVIDQDGQRTALAHEHRGVWAGMLERNDVPDYRIDVTYDSDDPIPADDPYRFLPSLGDVDLHLIGEGRHEQLWQALGAHVRHFPSVMGAVTGTSFAVWAPSARGVQVVGDFNGWDGNASPMRSLGSSGVWELFLPNVVDGNRYKFKVLGADGQWRDKADPMAFATEVPPLTGSVVFTPTYAWGDDEWLEHRASTNVLTSPMSIYEVHLGSWRQGLSYLQLADELTAYILEQGFTHVEFLPVAEHPYGPSWGYQVTSYFAPTSRFGTPDELRHLIDTLHRAGVGVIIDWVPAHFPKDEWALARFDGTPLYEHSDPMRGEHPDWGTYVFNFGRREVRNFLVSNAVFWCEEFHVDGLRVDAVASMLYLDYSRKEGEWSPNEFGGRENLDAVAFLQEANATVYRRVPGVVTIAEESTSWPGVTRPTHLGGLGFGLKWNMGWMHDSLDYLSREPVHRQWHHNEMTFAMMYAWSENYVLPVSHDEVVHGKGSLVGRASGDRWQEMATLRTYLAYMWAHPGKQLLFMGSEFGQGAEWNDNDSLQWWLLEHGEHRGVLNSVAHMNRVYRSSPALYTQDTSPRGFEWIDANDAAGNVFTWLRWGSDGSAMACVFNFSAVVLQGYRLGLPKPGWWAEVLNTDAAEYGGTGVGNLGGVHTEDVPWHNRPVSASITIPPLAAVWFQLTP